MSSIFSKIINGDLPCYKIAENKNCFAFLDINPNSKGHTLCLLKKEVDKIFDLSEYDYIELMKFSRRVALAIKKVVSCNRIGISVIGLEVPHVHVHLIPRSRNDSAGPVHSMFTDKIELTDAEIDSVCDELKVD